MRWQLTPQERLLAALGALVVVLLLGYAIISGQLNAMTSEAARKRDTAKSHYQEAVNLVSDYERKGRLIEERKERIQETSDFDLPTFVTDIAARMRPRFEPKAVGRATSIPLAQGKYLLTRIKYTYADKSIDDIVNYLYGIEDPVEGVIISNVLIQTANEVGDKFNMVIMLSVVTQAAPE
ncbi:MAG: hypothetical protein JW889_00725 [Verrucomicrobia bacterium]|nr:hypothetical protein [Verrucomicrobiota bacterium]